MWRMRWGETGGGHVNPVSVLDVAAYILEQRGSMTTMKLQKLVYYCQAWSLVWDDRPLFSETIEAWANGPVVRRLYDVHRGQFTIDEIPGRSPIRDTVARDTIDAVLEAYGGYSAYQLSIMTHHEHPWLVARDGLPEWEPSDAVISHASMAEYYGSLTAPD